MRPSTTYLLFGALFDLGMALTFVPYVPFLLSIGLSLSEVSLVNAWFIGASLVAEIPTGLFADRVSRAYSIRIGVAIAALSSFGYATAGGFRSALLFEVLIGVSLAFINGALGAWIKDGLRRHGEDGAYERTVVTSSVIRGLAVILGGLLGWGISSLWGYRVGWIVSGVFMLCALLVSLRWMETDRPAQTARNRHALAASWSALRTRPALMWAIAAATVFSLVTPFNHYWSPFVTGRAGNACLGWVWILMQFPIIIASQTMRRYGTGSRHKALMITACLFVAGASLIVMTRIDGVVFPMTFIMVHECSRGVFMPLLEIFTQRKIDDDYRATYMSLQSFISKCGCALVLFLVAFGTNDMVTNELTIGAVWAACGGLLVLFSLGLGFFRPRA